MTSHLRRCCYLFPLLFSCFSLFPATTFATHIRAGEITARRIDPQSFTYEITLRGYADRDSEVIFGSNGTLDFGDGTFLQLTNDGDDIPRTMVGHDTWLYEMKIVHTFPAARTYVVSFRELNRNEGVLNMTHSESMAFYIETVLVADPFIGINNTPVLTRAAADVAIAGETYHHQPGAVDIDGDSLSYHLIPCRQDRNTEVADYRLPHLTFPAGDSRNGISETGSAPLFSINPVTGDVIWDAPTTPGEYNFAIRITEWRKISGSYYQIGSVVRDMQIIVDTYSLVGIPQLHYPFTTDAISPAAGETLEWTIIAQAPTAEDSIVLELRGDLVLQHNTTISSQQLRAKGEARIILSWLGEADRGQHYQLIAYSYNPMSPYIARRTRATIFYPRSNDTAPEPEPLALADDVRAKVTLYPNPVSGSTLYLQLPEAAGKEVRFLLFNTKGQLQMQETFLANHSRQVLQLPALAKGMYVYQLQYKDRIYSSKLVVQ